MRTSVLLAFGLFLTSVPVQADWKIRRLTDNNTEDRWPQISGNNVVWVGDYSSTHIDNNTEIFLFDGASTIQLTDDYDADFLPRISGSNVLWSSEFIFGPPCFCTQVCFYDGTNTIRLTEGGDNIMSQISGANVVWLRDHKHIFLYNGTHVQQLTNEDSRKWNPQISGANVVWEGWANYNWEIFFYDGNSIIQLTDNFTSDTDPQVSGSNVVWEQAGDILLYDGTRTIRLTDASSVPARRPQISGANVVWEGLRRRDWEIFSYDGGGVTQITDNDHDDLYPQVSGSNVVWMGSDGSDYEIFFYDGSSTTQLTDNNEGDGMPQVSGWNVVWMGSVGDDYEIFMATWCENCPQAEGDEYETDADEPLSVAAPGILENDTDPNGDSLTVISIDDTNTIGLVTSWSADGSFEYDPNGQFCHLGLGEQAEDYFDYTISDGQNGEDTARVTITITGVCPCAILLDGQPFKEIQFLKALTSKFLVYRFRDEVMAQTAEGNEYIALYYEHAREVAAMLLRDPKLALRSAEMLVRLTPKIQAAVNGKPTSLRQEDVFAAENLMDLVAAKASPKLQAAIERVRGDLRGGKLDSMFAPMPATRRGASTVGGGCE